MVPETVNHVIHIAATCISLGGLFYSRMVLLPNMKYIPESERENYLNQMVRRFSYIKWTGIAILAITGIIQWLNYYPLVQNKPAYIMAFALKMGGAFALLSITFLLSLPNDRLKAMQNNRRFWAGLNLIAGLLILVGAALMKAIRNGQL